MARSTKKAGSGTRKLQKGKKIEATRPLDKVSLGSITITKQIDQSSPNVGTSTAPSK